MTVHNSKHKLWWALCSVLQILLYFGYRSCHWSTNRRSKWNIKPYLVSERRRKIVCFKWRTVSCSRADGCHWLLQQYWRHAISTFYSQSLSCPETVIWIFASSVYIQTHFTLILTEEANCMNTEKSALETGTILFAIKAIKVHKQMSGQAIIVVNSGKRVKNILAISTCC